MNKTLFILLFCVLLTSCAVINPREHLRQEWEEFNQSISERMTKEINLEVKYFAKEDTGEYYALGSRRDASIYLIDKKTLKLTKEIYPKTSLTFRTNKIVLSPEDRLWLLFDNFRKHDLINLPNRWIRIINPEDNKVEHIISFNKIRNPETVCFDKEHAYVAALSNGMFFGLAKIDKDYNIILENVFKDTGYLEDIFCADNSLYVLTGRGIYKINKTDLSLIKSTLELDISSACFDKGMIYISNRINSTNYELLTYNIERDTLSHFADLPQNTYFANINYHNNQLIGAGGRSIVIFDLATNQISKKKTNYFNSAYPLSEDEIIYGNKVYNTLTEETITIENLPDDDWTSIVALTTNH